jgi:hypothetical protein
MDNVRFRPIADLPRGIRKTPCLLQTQSGPQADIYDNIPDLLLMRVRSWTSVQLDFAA